MTPRVSPQPPVHVAVIGAGAFGRNHLRVYRELERSGFPVRLAAIVEPDADSGVPLAEQYGVPLFPSFHPCISARESGALSLRAVSVCVPTSAHLPVASSALAAGLDVLLEKPVASTVAEADTLIAIAGQQSRILQVGHLERFNPAVRAAATRIHHPMFFEAHRLSVFTPRSLDVDVVLDLMIHDLDIVLGFVQSPVRDLRAVGLPVLSGKVDIANVRIEFASGAVANFTASRVSTERVRKLRFFQPHQYVSIDYARQDLLIIDVADADEAPPDEGARGALAINKPQISSGEPLRLEIEAFLSSVLHRTPPVVSGEDGRSALALALDINQAIAEHASRAGLARL